MPDVYYNTTATPTMPAALGCDVNCDLILIEPVFIAWDELSTTGINQTVITEVVNQTAITIVVDVSLNVTKTSTHTDTQMIQSWYDVNQHLYPSGVEIIVGANGKPSISWRGRTV